MARHLCNICGIETKTYVRCEACKRKVPLCEACFKELYPTKKNKAKVEFWRVIHPIIGKAT